MNILQYLYLVLVVFTAICTLCFFMSGSPTLVRVKWVSHNYFQCCNSLVMKIQKPNNQKLHLTVFLFVDCETQLGEEAVNFPWMIQKTSLSFK